MVVDPFDSWTGGSDVGHGIGGNMDTHSPHISDSSTGDYIHDVQYFGDHQSGTMNVCRLYPSKEETDMRPGRDVIGELQQGLQADNEHCEPSGLILRGNISMPGPYSKQTDRRRAKIRLAQQAFRAKTKAQNAEVSSLLDRYAETAVADRGTSRRRRRPN